MTGLSLRKQATLAGVMLFGSFGDIALAHGMKQVGRVSLSNFSELFAAVFTPWVAIGILLLMAFFASYLSALSFADLTYVLPATAVGYLFTALLAQLLLGEHVDLKRWLGIALIAVGVGFVTRGPHNTVKYVDGEPHRIHPVGGDD